MGQSVSQGSDEEVEVVRPGPPGTHMVVRDGELFWEPGRGLLPEPVPYSQQPYPSDFEPMRPFLPNFPNADSYVRDPIILGDGLENADDSEMISRVREELASLRVQLEADGRLDATAQADLQCLVNNVSDVSAVQMLLSGRIKSVLAKGDTASNELLQDVLSDVQRHLWGLEQRMVHDGDQVVPPRPGEHCSGSAGFGISGERCWWHRGMSQTSTGVASGLAFNQNRMDVGSHVCLFGDCGEMLNASSVAAGGNGHRLPDVFINILYRHLLAMAKAMGLKIKELVKSDGEMVWPPPPARVCKPCWKHMSENKLVKKLLAAAPEAKLRAAVTVHSRADGPLLLPLLMALLILLCTPEK